MFFILSICIYGADAKKFVHQEFVGQYGKLNAPLLFSIFKDKPCIAIFNNTCLKAERKYHNKIIVNFSSRTVICNNKICGIMRKEKKLVF